MDEVARYNQERWKALAGANALFSRPRLDLDSRRLSDDTDMHSDSEADPGSWNHYTAFAPPWLNILARLDN